MLIDYPEWKRALGIRNDFLAQRIFALVDTDGTGFIDFDEFNAFAGYFYAEDQRRRLEFVFRIYDLDGDGAISRTEIREILRASFSEQQVIVDESTIKELTNHFLRRADIDKDGQVALEDFIALVGQYPGIDEQFSVYAANWLNEGRRLQRPRIGLTGFLTRLRLGWVRRRRALLWSALYLGANALLFASAILEYAEAGASVAVQIARGAGACLNLNVGLVFLPMCKSLWTWVRRTPAARLFPLDAMPDIHRYIGYAIAGFSAIHVVAHLKNYADIGASFVDNLLLTGVGVTGVVASLLLIVLVILATIVRRRNHEVFVLSHFLYPGFLVALLFHASTPWMWLSVPLLMYLTDGAIRAFLRTHTVRVVDMTPLANGVTRVQLAKPKRFEFHPGDYLSLNLRDISALQWHPFTISAAPEASNIAVHVRNNGDWSGALHNASRNTAFARKKWSARIDGPYAAPSSKVHRSRVAVLIAAGIGVTPFASVLQSIVLRHVRARSERGKPDQTIYFHWLNRSQHSYEWFMDLLLQAEDTLGDDRFKLHVHLTSLAHDLTNIAMQIAMDSYRERHSRDPITGLRAKTSAGRPDWSAIFAAVTAAHSREWVDVFYCGPRPLAAVIRRKCREFGLQFHEERF